MARRIFISALETPSYNGKHWNKNNKHMEAII
jgi:hypothetical protein